MKRLKRKADGQLSQLLMELQLGVGKTQRLVELLEIYQDGSQTTIDQIKQFLSRNGITGTKQVMDLRVNLSQVTRKLLEMKNRDQNLPNRQFIIDTARKASELYNIIGAFGPINPKNI